MGAEQYVECCEWCGKDTALWGRFYLQDGPGLKIVLCGPCAATAELYTHWGDEQCGEVVCSPMITDR